MAEFNGRRASEMVNELIYRRNLSLPLPLSLYRDRKSARTRRRKEGSCRIKRSIPTPTACQRRSQLRAKSAERYRRRGDRWTSLRVAAGQRPVPETLWTAVERCLIHGPRRPPSPLRPPSLARAHKYTLFVPLFRPRAAAGQPTDEGAQTACSEGSGFSGVSVDGSIRAGGW